MWFWRLEADQKEKNQQRQRQMTTTGELLRSTLWIKKLMNTYNVINIFIFNKASKYIANKYHYIDNETGIRSWSIGTLLSCLLSPFFCMITLFKLQQISFKPWYALFPAWNVQFDRICNGCAMVTETGTIVLIMKMASKFGSLSSFCCMKFLTSNDFGGRLSDNPVSLKVG